MTATHPSALLDVYARLDLEIVRGEGSELVASDGRRFLDFYAGHAVSALGYGHPALIAALDEQARTLFFQSNLVPSKTREEVAARLAALAPIDGAKVFFCNSGAEATENALRVACRAT
ncbi:MAG: aminotransferase class III-fold pyridoxal phosphate-dependent enzyme, partial [Planctomycetota bacterium]